MQCILVEKVKNKFDNGSAINLLAEIKLNYTASSHKLSEACVAKSTMNQYSIRKVEFSEEEYKHAVSLVFHELRIFTTRKLSSLKGLNQLSYLFCVELQKEISRLHTNLLNKWNAIQLRSKINLMRSCTELFALS